MKLILEVEASKDLKIKDFAKLNKALEFLGLKLKKFSSIENYRQRIIDGSGNNNSKCVYSALCGS
jgi:hypothetical protein